MAVFISRFIKPIGTGVHIYGVEWDWTSSGPTKGTRTDDAAGFEDPNPAVNNGTGSSPFDDLYPWSEMVKEDRTGGVMVDGNTYLCKQATVYTPDEYSQACEAV